MQKFKKSQKKLRVILSSMLAVAVGISFVAAPGLFSAQKANAQTVTAPVASSVSYSVAENTSLTGTLTANDTNSPALPLTYSIVSDPVDGTLSNLSSASGTFTYAPDSGFTGQDSFTFMANNGTSNSNTATETIWVTSPSSTPTSTVTAPIVWSGSSTVSENDSVVGMLNASDTNSPPLPLTYSIVNYPMDGTLASFSAASGTFTYVPNNGFTGQDWFTFMVNNGTSNSATGTETIWVTASTSTPTSTPTSTVTAPMTWNGSSTVTENSSVTGMLNASDTNSPALPLTYSIVSDPMDGTISDLSTSSGAFTYTPNAGFTGQDWFTFMANNGTSNSNTSTETIWVTPLSNTPTSTPTSTITSAQFLALENQIQQLEQEILSLLQQVLAGNGGGTGTGGGGVTTMGTPSVSPQNATVTAGTSIDFGGRDFAPNEKVTVTENGQTVTTAQADGGGNFSTGSLSVPGNASGTQTYTFTGQSSGTVLTDTIMVVQ